MTTLQNEMVLLIPILLKKTNLQVKWIFSVCYVLTSLKEKKKLMKMVGLNFFCVLSAIAPALKVSNKISWTWDNVVALPVKET